MGSLTQFAQKKVLDHILKTASYSPPATVYVGLSIAEPGDDGSGWSNPTYTGYARKAITFAAASGRSIAQTGVVTFDPCTGGTDDIQYWGLFDAVSGGNLLAQGELVSQKTVVDGNTPSLANGEVVVTFDATGVFTGIANLILDWLFRAQTLAQPTDVKVGLSTTTPTDGGPNITEPSGGAYAQVTLNTWNGATVASPSVATNDGAITFATPTADWGTVVAAVVYADTTPFAYGDIVAQTIGDEDPVAFADEALEISLE